ncbi:MAG: trehalose-6-phosphate synthase [Actinobacteria bacterium]|nr:trehalose-6-phosphate synthase [Actinomycetota bacterium]
MTGQRSERRFIVASNRLPFVLSRDGEGTWSIEPGSGGLVTALLPVLRNRGGLWIGWPGTSESVPRLPELMAQVGRELGCTFRPVTIDDNLYRDYYLGYSNQTLWPLFHDLQSRCVFEPAYWQAYMEVNRRFAQEIKSRMRASDFVWVHDYQLMMVADHLRKEGVSGRLGFFLHIPFPPPDIFIKLPERQALLTGLLQYDLIGLQTQRDRRNFVQCVRMLTKNARVRVAGSLHRVWLEDREVQVAAFPISIDYNAFHRLSMDPRVRALAAEIKEALPGRALMLGVDRLDYTKGIPERLHAFRHLLRSHPETHGRVNLVQVVVPSRAQIEGYEELHTEIERLVGAINGEFTRRGWVPIHYMYRNLPLEELIAYYRASEMAVITPLKDGMNLVAKEYCACNADGKGVLVLSQFAGASAQLGRHALVVNPYDVEQTSAALYQAWVMPDDERRERMRRIRRNLRRNHIFWWVDSFVRAAVDRRLEDFPVQEEFIPEMVE